MRGRRLLLGLALVACGGKTGSPARAKPSTVVVTAAPTFFAAREDGVFEHTYDGAIVRQWSRTPATKPRLLPGGRKLVYLHAEHLDLYALDLASGQETLVAKGPSIQCAGRPPDDREVRVEVQSDDDLTIDLSGGAACLAAMDRNANMAEVFVRARIDLANGTVEAEANGLEPGCTLEPRRPLTGTCNAPDSLAGLEQAAIATNDLAMPPGFTPMLESPSRRWVLLRGNDSEGDYFHYQVLLAQRGSSNVFPILFEGVAEAAGWATPLSKAQLDNEDAEAMWAVAGDVVTETTIRWLGQGDTLQVGDYLVVPGERVVRVGNIAR